MVILNSIMTTMLQRLCFTAMLGILLLPGESLIQGSTFNRPKEASFLPLPLRSQLTEIALNLQDEDTTEETRGNYMVVTSEMEMDIPIQICYDAFSDLPRQPSWSPWLHSVTYDQENPLETVWKMRYLGLPISWRAISTNKSRPHLIEWKSIQGLKNFGRVDFTQLSDDTTHMKLTLTFELPRIIARVIEKSSRTTRMVENRMLRTTLQNFRNIVLENDMKKTDER